MATKRGQSLRAESGAEDPHGAIAHAGRQRLTRRRPWPVAPQIQPAAAGSTDADAHHHHSSDDGQAPHDGARAGDAAAGCDQDGGTTQRDPCRARKEALAARPPWV